MEQKSRVAGRERELAESRLLLFVVSFQELQPMLANGMDGIPICDLIFFLAFDLNSKMVINSFTNHLRSFFSATFQYSLQNTPLTCNPHQNGRSRPVPAFHTQKRNPVAAQTALLRTSLPGSHV